MGLAVDQEVLDGGPCRDVRRSGLGDDFDAVGAVDGVGALEDALGPILVVVLLIGSPLHLRFPVRQKGSSFAA